MLRFLGRPRRLLCSLERPSPWWRMVLNCVALSSTSVLKHTDDKAQLSTIAPHSCGPRLPALSRDAATMKRPRHAHNAPEVTRLDQFANSTVAWLHPRL